MPGDGKRITTANTKDGHEVIGVEIGCGPKDFDKLNMDGSSPVRIVKRGK
jgi:hypothetical protein